VGGDDNAEFGVDLQLSGESVPRGSQHERPEVCGQRFGVHLPGCSTISGLGVPVIESWWQTARSRGISSHSAARTWRLWAGGGALG